MKPLRKTKVTRVEVENQIAKELGWRWTPTMRHGFKAQLWDKLVDARVALINDKIDIRRAVANYVRSEGCSCCEGHNHDKHGNTLGKVLQAEKYTDGSGYDLYQYATKRKPR